MIHDGKLEHCTGTFTEIVAYELTQRGYLVLKGAFPMPVLFIEAPPGICPEANRKMVQKLTEAIDEANHIGDTLITYVEKRLGGAAL